MSQATTSSAILNKPLSTLKGIGPKTAEKFALLGCSTCTDLLFHLPSRYEDRTRVTPAAQCEQDTVVVVEGTIVKSHIVFAKGRMLVVTCEDSNGDVFVLRFFQFHQSMQLNFKRHSHIRAIGTAKRSGKQLQLIHPEYHLFNDEPPMLAQTYTPIYPSTSGLTQTLIQKAIAQVLVHCTDERLTAAIPDALMQAHSLMGIARALRTLHAPPASIPLAELNTRRTQAHRTLIIEELLAYQWQARLKRQARAQNAITLNNQDSLIERLQAELPFALTGAQQNAWHSIESDMAQQMPMQRLLQGDVGCGKTLVALLAMLRAFENGYKSVFMAPTEVLAIQHAKSIAALCQALNVTVVSLTGSQTARERDDALSHCRAQAPCLIVGTHAVFQESVEITQLALIVIDEQHRFGVDQREALANKAKEAGISVHQLMMSATPIPRSLAMSAYADIDITTIDELPAGRQTIQTAIIDSAKRDAVIERLQHIKAQQQQCYWICPLIDESDKINAQALEQTMRMLTKALPSFSLGAVHGRMNAQDKQAVMAEFKASQIDMLVATTVVEVGIDVPNATLIVIENAERLGLAQLHQLRGRVGRGSAASFCLLLYQAPLSEVSRERLQILRKHQDGFAIAEADLKLRGPGDFLGTAQSGQFQLRVADILRDAALVRQCADAVKTYDDYFKDGAGETLFSRWRA